MPGPRADACDEQLFVVLGGHDDGVALAASAHDKADFIGGCDVRTLDANPVAVLLVVCKGFSRCEPWEKFVQSARRAGACSDDEVVAEEIDTTSGFADSCHLDSLKLPLLRLLDADDFLAEAEFDAFFFACLVKVFS